MVAPMYTVSSVLAGTERELPRRAFVSRRLLCAAESFSRYGMVVVSDNCGSVFNSKSLCE